MGGGSKALMVFRSSVYGYTGIQGPHEHEFD